MAIGATVGAGGCMLELHIGDGVPATSVREVGAFNGITSSASIPVDVQIDAGAPEVPAVEVQCDSNLLDYVETRIDRGNLVIGEERRGLVQVRLVPKTDCRVVVVARDLLSATTAGLGSLAIRGDPVGLVWVAAAGEGPLRVDAPIVSAGVAISSTEPDGVDIVSLDADRVTLATSLSGAVRVDEGRADRLSIQLMDGGTISASGLVADEVEVDLSGWGTAFVTATDRIEAIVSGSGNLVVDGAPRDRDVLQTGTGSVTYSGG